MTPLRRAVCLWWVTTVAGSVAVVSPLLPWLDVLRANRFGSVTSDMGLLFDRLFTGASLAQTLSASALVEAALWQVLLWRLVLLVPMALTMGVLTHATQTDRAPIGKPRGLLRALTRLPQFVGVTVIVQSCALLGGGVGLCYSISRLTASEARALDFIVGGGLLVISVVFVATCLTTLEAARLALFRRSKQLVPTSGLSCLLDGIDVLRRHRWRLLGTVVGYWGLGVGAAALLSGVATYVATLWPSGFGNVVTWSAAQLGIGAALVCRVSCWRYVWHRVNTQLVAP
jgi:hypothetical protein